MSTRIGTTARIGTSVRIGAAVRALVRVRIVITTCAVVGRGIGITVRVVVGLWFGTAGTGVGGHRP